jgi:hypothetical protein
MKTSTLLLVAGAVGVGVFLLTRKSSAASTLVPGLTDKQATDCMSKIQPLYTIAAQGQQLTATCRAQGGSSQACKDLAALTGWYTAAAQQYIKDCKTLPQEFTMPAAFEPRGAAVATKGW